jgi:hypothetical protein
MLESGSRRHCQIERICVMEHTKGTWSWHETADGSGAVVADGLQVARCQVFGPFGQDTANARRIAACVNACRGINTTALEYRAHLLKAEDCTLRVLREQRDELLAALTALVALCDEHCRWDRRFDDALDAADEAVTNAKGGA